MSKFVNLLNKLNLKLQLGYFVLDPEDGELTFRIVCPVDKGAIRHCRKIQRSITHTHDSSFSLFLKFIH